MVSTAQERRRPQRQATMRQDRSRREIEETLLLLLGFVLCKKSGFGTQGASA